MLYTALIAIVAFILGYAAHLVKTNRLIDSMTKANKAQVEKSFEEGSKTGWHMALNDPLMIASKYHEYYPNQK